METAHEAAVAHLKTLDRAEHPVLEEVLAVARMYPVEVQRACEDAVKRGEDSAVLYPIKAIADRQAVELQQLLDALTSPAPGKVALPGPILREQLATEGPALRAMTGDEPLDPTQPAGPVSPTLPKNPGDPDPNLPGTFLDTGISKWDPSLPHVGSDPARSALFPHEVAVGSGSASTSHPFGPDFDHALAFRVAMDEAERHGDDAADDARLAAENANTGGHPAALTTDAPPIASS